MKQSLLVAALVALAMTACGKKEEPQPAPAPAPAVEAPKPADTGAMSPVAPSSDLSAPAAGAAPAPASGMAPAEGAAK